MIETKKEIKIHNIEHPNVKELLNLFKNRHEMNVVDVAEIIANLITTLKVDHDEGRHKNYSISVGHLGEVLGIGKGVISQYMSVWNMSQESKDYLRNYNLSLINAYEVSRIKGKNETEAIILQKKKIEEKSSGSSGLGKRTDILLHMINKSEMICKSLCLSNNIPDKIFEGIISPEENNKNNYDILVKKIKSYIIYIDKCINYLSPRILKLPYYRKELEFCNLMIENEEQMFCGKEIGKECLNKQIRLISDEILSIESEQKLPKLSQLIMMKNDLEKNI